MSNTPNKFEQFGFSVINGGRPKYSFKYIIAPYDTAIVSHPSMLSVAVGKKSAMPFNNIDWI